MRENRSYGSEGGAAELNRPSLPLSMRVMATMRVMAIKVCTALAAES
jgi:hypothetical protein